MDQNNRVHDFFHNLAALPGSKTPSPTSPSFPYIPETDVAALRPETVVETQHPSWAPPSREKLCARTHLGEEGTQLLEWLEKTCVADLLDDKDTFGRLVPCESLAGRVLDVPRRGETETERLSRD